MAKTPAQRKTLYALLGALALSGAGAYTEATDSPHSMSNHMMRSQIKSIMDDGYKVGCATIQSTKNIRNCGLVLSISTQMVATHIQNRILEKANALPHTGDQAYSDKMRLANVWHAAACTPIGSESSLPELQRDADYCLTVAMKVSDIFNADEGGYLKDIADKMKKMTEDAAKQAPYPTMDIDV